MRLILAVIASVSSIAAMAGELKVHRVIDGDTLQVCASTIDCVTVRVNDLNTPEKRLCRSKNPLKMSDCEPCVNGAVLGRKASYEASKMFSENPVVTIDVIGLDRYGRTIADVFLRDGTSYATRMIEMGFGVEYPCPKGRCKKRPRPWCDTVD